MHSLRTLRVLLVEDNDEHARIVARHLRRVDGAEIMLFRAATLAEALQRLGDCHHDAVLLDLKLPDSDFDETVRRVLAQAPATPIVVLSTLEEREFARRSLHQGAQDYLYKTDLSSELLFRALDYAVERQKVAERARVEARYKQALFELGQRALAARTTRLLFDEAAVLLRSALNVAVLSIWERTSDDGLFRLASCDGCASDAIGMSVPAPDGATLVPLDELRVRYGLDDNIAVAIRCQTDGEPDALLAAHARGARAFCADDTFVLESAANVLAAALLRIRAEESLVRDIRRRERAEAALRENERLRETFIGILGHDLRNPLAAIVGGAGFALEVTDDPKVRRSLEPVLASSRRMGRMIDQLLDITRIRLGGGITLQPAEADLSTILEQVLHGVGAQRQRFRVEIVGDSRGRWDPDRLFQIISNVAGNASEHSPPGTPIDVCMDGRAPDCVELRIRNAGPALPEPVRAAMFEPFRRSARQGAARQGLGLGLYICKHLAEAHGGTIACESSDAGGTIITIRLPRHIHG